MSEDVQRIEWLLASSSLGAPAARAVRRRTPPELAARLVRGTSNNGREQGQMSPALQRSANGARAPQQKGTTNMAPRNERHVTPHPDGGWQVTKPGGSRASARTDTQSAGIDRAREIVQGDGGGEVVIHRPDGTIRDSDTVAPGNDPFPPRDKK